MLFQPFLCRQFIRLLLLAAGVGFSLPICSQPIQADTTLIIRLDSLPAGGIVLDKGWKWHSGDDPAWAKRTFDDRGWDTINPNTDIHYLPQVRQAQIGWLRLRLRVGPALRQKSLALVIGQMGASELYLNERLIQRFGVVSAKHDQEQTYNPKGKPITLQLDDQPEQILAVRYSFTHQNPYVSYNRLTGSRCFSAWLTPLEFAWDWFVGWHDFLIPPMALYGGLFLMLTLLHGFFFVAYPRQQANGYFALYALFQCLIIGSDASFLLTHSAGWVFTGIMLDRLSSLLALACMLRAVYSFFNHRIQVTLRLAIGALLVSACLPFLAYERGWEVGLFGSILLVNLDILRVSWLAIRQSQPDARLLFWGQVIVLLAYWPTVLIRMAPDSVLHQHLAYYMGPFYSTLYLFWVLTLPVTVSFALARQFARLNDALAKKLIEVEELSQQNLAQEAEKQQRLATENGRLEAQVVKRTEEIRQQNALLAQQAEQLQDQDQLKSRLITNLTHEFRTPLSLILAPVNKLLADPRLPGRYTSLLSVVNRNARQLLSLINQLLDLSKLDAGQMKIVPTPTHLVQFLDEIISLFRPQADTKGIALRWTYQTDTKYGLVDGDKWTKILTNLLSNALKYTPKDGQVTVQVSVRAQQALVTITDTGVGIEAGKLPHIFDRFYQADDSVTRLHEGTGIGLSLVNELTDLLGGTIAITSTVGQGTTVDLKLPLAPIDETEDLALPHETGLSEAVFNGRTEPGNGVPAQPQPTEEKPLVLVVEDNAELRDFIGQELTPLYRVLTAVNGVEAWDIVRGELPDLVVSDVMMPLRDGVALTGLIKSDPLTNHIAVVLLTARTAQQNRLEGLTQGADDYLTKPFHTDELLLRLRNLLTRRQQLQHYFQRRLVAVSDAPEPMADDGATPVDAELSSPFLETLYELIEARLDDSTFKVEELATQVGMSRRNLYRKLKALTNLSPQKVVFQYRLRRAADLLRSGYNVSETAYLVGYESASHFSSAFKTLYQQTPSAFVKT